MGGRMHELDPTARTRAASVGCWQGLPVSGARQDRNGWEVTDVSGSNTAVSVAQDGCVVLYCELID